MRDSEDGRDQVAGDEHEKTNGDEDDSSGGKINDPLTRSEVDAPQKDWEPPTPK